MLAQCTIFTMERWQSQRLNLVLLKGNGSAMPNCAQPYFLNGGILPSIIEWISCMSGGSRRSNTARSSSSPWMLKRPFRNMIRFVCFMLYRVPVQNREPKEPTWKVPTVASWLPLKRRRPYTFSSLRITGKVHPLCFLSCHHLEFPSLLLNLTWTGHCNYSLDKGSCTRLCSGTHVQVSLHCRMALWKASTLVVHESSIHSPNMERCLGLLAY